jgi:hypothetical protein
MKTSRNYLYMAALLLATTFMACSSESDDTTTDSVTPQPEQPVTSGKEVILTGTLTSKGSEVTRSVSADGTTAWKKGEKIAIYYQKTNGTYATATATIKSADIDDDTHTTSYEATLTDPKNGTNVKLVYPASMSDGAGSYSIDGLLTDQRGSIEDISDKWDLATGSGYMTVNGSKATLPTLTLQNQLCICKFTIDGVPEEEWDNSLGIYPLIINDGTHEYNLEDLDRSKIDGGVIYLAMLPTAGSTFTFFTHSNVGTPDIKSDGTIRAAKGDWFTRATGITKNNVTNAHVGHVFDKNLDIYYVNDDNLTFWFKKTVNNVTLEPGKFYQVPITLISGADLDPEIVPIAVITYVGQDTGISTSSSYNHGLAMALFDADGWQIPEAVAGIHESTKYQWKTSYGVLDNGNYQITNETFFWGVMKDKKYMDGLYWTQQHNNDEYPACKVAWNYGNICGFDPSSKGATHWFLPSAFQWQSMVDACNYYLPILGQVQSGLPKIFWSARERQGTRLSNSNYWTSTEYDSRYAWAWWYTGGTTPDNDGSWRVGPLTSNYDGTKTDSYAVRAVFAF